MYGLYRRGRYFAPSAEGEAGGAASTTEGGEGKKEGDSGGREEGAGGGAELYKFKDKNLTHEEAQVEMDRLREKETGSDRKLRAGNARGEEADAKVEKAGKAIRAAELIQKMSKGDERAAEELIRDHPEMGVTQAQLDAWRTQRKGETSAEEREEDPGPIRREELSEDRKSVV